MWKFLLQRAIAGLMGKDWSKVMQTVNDLMARPWTGAQKREIALTALRELGIEVATWVLSAAIEIAYGKLKEQ